MTNRKLKATVEVTYIPPRVDYKLLTEMGREAGLLKKNQSYVRGSTPDTVMVRTEIGDFDALVKYAHKEGILKPGERMAGYDTRGNKIVKIHKR